MRIERAHIFGFGIHADRAFTFGEGAPLTVCYGLNEAGKSTLLAFIRSILFGFPQRNQQKRYAPINGGEYGGYLVVIDETGKKYRIERTIAGNAAGKTSAGKLRIYDELLGTELPEQMLSQLTGGISAELYRNLFAFGLSELQELRTLQADEINSFLFSTGIGIPGGAINKAEKMLSQRLDELYKIRGAKQEINRQLKKIELLEHELRRSKELLGSYNIRVGELAEKKREIAAVQSRLAKADETKRWLEQCVAAAPNWRQLREVELELRQLPPIDSFPEQALPRFAAERAAEDKLLAEISRKRQQLSQLSEELAGIEPNSALIAAAPEIAKLAEELGVFKQSRSAVVQLAEEIRHISAELRDLLKQIDPAWTDGQLRNFSLAVGEKEALRQYRDQFALLQTDKADAEGALQAILAQLDDHARMVEEKRELIAQMRHTGHARGTSPPEPHKPEEVAAALAKLKQAFAEWKHMALQRDYLARRLSDLEMAAAAGEKRSRKAGTSGAFSRNLPRFIGVLLNVALPFVLYGYTHDVLVSAGAFLLLMLSQIVLWRGKPAKRQIAGHESAALVGLCQSAERELAAHEARMAQAEAQMRECVGTMMNGIGPAEDLADIAQTLSDGRMDAQLVGRMDLAMERWQEAFSELNRLERELAELARQESLLKAKKAQAAERIAAISERRDKLLTDWQDWLSGRNLAISLSVEAVEEIFGLAARAKQLMHMRESKQAELAGLREQIAAFQAQCGQIAASCGYDSQDDAEMLVRRLQEEAEAQKRLVDMRERKREKARELKSEAAAQETELLRVRGRIAELLREAKAENEEDFRRRAALFERICRLRQQSEHYAALVYAQCGERERDKLIAALRAEDEQSLNRKLNETAAEIAELDNRLAQLLVEKGALEHRIQALESDGSHADKLQQLEEEVALLRHSAKEWAVYALSLRLIQAAKEICEKDKQPGVLLRASAYFRLITGGKFTRVLAPVGAKLLKVERANGEQLEPAQLSRGTAEQLYLSMRFALAAEIAQKALMPIIMDDIFVNFDKPRLLHALKAVEKVAQKQQVLLFTCHAHVREAVLAVMPDARLLPLDGSS